MRKHSQDPKGAHEARSEPPPSRRPPRVLVVDDDLTFRVLAEAALVQTGFQVTAVETGEAALEIYTELRPDLVLLDLLLPGCDGFEVCVELNRRYGEALAPVLMVTGTDDESSINRGFEVGASDFITKPLNWRLLAHRALHLINASRALTDLRYSQTSLAKAQRVAQLGSYEWDVEANEVHWSDETFRILGLEPGAHPPGDSTPLARIHPDDQETVNAQLQQAIEEVKSFTLTHRILLPDGDARQLRHQGEVVTDPENGNAWVTGTILDVTEHERALEQLRFLANYDPLTGLANRRTFKTRLESAIGNARTSSGQLAVMFLDLDRFKRINDTLGHSAGDQLLQKMAERIRSRLRWNDSVSHLLPQDVVSAVSRLGGDEFTLLLSRVASAQEAAVVARRVLRALSDPLCLGEQDVAMTASIGISLFPEDGEDIETLLKHADVAMYEAKKQGGNLYRFFSESTNDSSIRALSLEAHLRGALTGDQLRLHFQPKVDLRTRRVTGMEALLRWQNPELGMISPGEFIPLAEESGMIPSIGSWVLQAACEQNKAWQEAGLPAIPVAVNVSTRQFANQNVRDAVLRALESSGLEPRFLELEITESTMMRDYEESAQTLHELKELGVSVTLDDFGTGFSSLACLQRFPLDSLKVDRAFVQGLPLEPDATGIVNAIVAMARVLRLKVVAEGVETDGQAAFLTGLGVDEMQGFLFSKPLPADDFARLLESQAR